MMQWIAIIGSGRSPEACGRLKLLGEWLERTISAVRSFVSENGWCLLTTTFVGIALKCYYSHADSETLIWMLHPTATLVEWISGVSFVHEIHVGFVNFQQGIVIAAACAGVNFLIIAFSMAAFAGIHHVQGKSLKWLWLAGSLVGAYGLTISVNALRIVLSIYSYNLDLHRGWLTPARVHHLEGVVIYFFFLCLFYRIIHAVFSLVERAKSRAETDDSQTAFAVWTPLFWYGLITLALPLLNDALNTESDRFFEHAGVIVIGCLIVLAIVVLIPKVGNLRFRKSH